MGARDRTENLFGALTLIAGDSMRRATEQAAGHRDAAPAALVALFASPEGRSVDELRRITGLTSSGGVRLVDRLVADGLAVRRRGSDRRVVIVGLTARGRRKAGAVLSARAAAVEQLLEPLDGHELDALDVLLDKLLGAHARRRITERARGILRPWTCRLCDQAACGRESGNCPAQREAAAVAEGRC